MLTISFPDLKPNSQDTSSPVQTKLRQALDGFLNRTFSSNLISESVRASRLITCLNAAHAALGPSAVSGILDNIFNGHWDEALQSVEIGHALRLWGHRRDHDLNVRRIVACIIARARQRDDRWTMLVKEEFGVPDGVLRDSLAHGDSVLLSILIHISRQANRAGSWTSGILSSLSKFDIRNTLPGLQHDFCTLWNEIAQEARNQGSFSTPAPRFSVRFATFTSPYIKAPMLPDCVLCFHRQSRLHSGPAIVVSTVRHRQSSPRLHHSCSCCHIRCCSSHPTW